MKIEKYLIWENIIRAVGIGLIVLFSWLIVEDKDGQFLALLAAAVCFLVPFFERLVRIKISAVGLEAELKDMIEDARVTIEQLQQLAVGQAKVSLESVHGAGRYGGGSSKDRRWKMRDELLDALRKIGVSDDQLDEVIGVEYRYVKFDDFSELRSVMSKFIPQEYKADWKKFLSDVSVNGIEHERTPSEMSNLIKKYSIDSEEVVEALEDYRIYYDTKTHRRPNAINF